MGTNRSLFISGSFWTLSQNIIYAVIGILQLAITSRILTPYDFGVYAIANFFLSLATIAFSMGFGAALIQKKGDIKPYLNAVWSIGLVVSVFAYVLLLIILYPVCKYYYHNTDAILPSAVILLGIFFTTGVNPKNVLFLKEIQLAKFFIVNTIPKLFSFAIVLFCVFYYRTYWALVLALLSECIFRFVFSYAIQPYKPNFVIDKEKVLELYKFGGWLQLKNIVAWLSGNIDVAIVGNLLGTSMLGIYNRAQSISAYPRTFVDGVINSVAFPLYSKINDDRDNLSRIVLQVQNIVILIISILALVILLYSDQIVFLIMGDQWSNMSDAFRWVFLGYLFQTFVTSFNPLLRSLGYTRMEFKFYMIIIVTMVIMLYPATLYGGLQGAGVSIMVSMFLVVPYLFFIIYKMTSVNIKPILESIIIASILVISTAVLFSIIDVFSGAFIWLLGSLLSAVCLMFFYVLVAAIFGKGPGMLFFNFFKKTNR